MTILTHIFLVLGIAYFGFRLLEHIFDWALKKDDEAWLKTVEKHKRKTAEKRDESKSESHTLVGKTKTFTHTADSPVSQSIPAIPDNSEEEKATIKENNFAEQNNDFEETEDDVEEENEMQVAYTMDEEDEDSIIREELLISDDPLPTVSASAILSRDLSRMKRWSQSDDTLDEEEQQKEVTETLQSIQGTDLLAKYKQVLSEKAQDHKKLLAAIRKAEEQEEQNANSDNPQEHEVNKDSEDDKNDKPLSYYL